MEFKGTPYEGRLVRIRVMEPADLDALMAIVNHHDTKKYLNSNLPFSRTQEKEWLDSIKEKANKKEEFVFAIEKLEDKALVGATGIHDFDWINRKCVVGIVIHHPRDHGKGYGSDALRLVMKVCFNVFNMHRIELEVVEYNARAIHVYQKLGFKQVARARQRHYFGGQYHDILVMDILDREYEEHRMHAGGR